MHSKLPLGYARVTCVMGAGAMGTLCAAILARGGYRVRLWGRRPEHIAALAAQRENLRYLPGLHLPESIELTTSAETALRQCGLIICAVPAQHIRAVMGQFRAVIPAGVPIASVAKGIENQTLLRPTEIITDVLGDRPVVAISGPCIAGELACGLPTTLVAASTDETLTALIQTMFTTTYLRIYRNADLRGVELAAAMKNVVAIAAGILDGLQAGTNAKAALLTRGLVEITRLGVLLGAQVETFSGLAGLGDLVTTCFAAQGRNRTLGEHIGRGLSPSAALQGMTGVVEGLPTTKSVMDLARRQRVEMPITKCLHAVLFEGKKPREGIADLMSRQPRHERDRCV